MPAFYDVAQGLPTMSEVNAIQLANDQRRQQTRIIRQSADYFDETGRSEAEQADDKLAIDRDANAIAYGNLRVRQDEYGLNLNKEVRDTMNNFADKLAMIQQYSDLNPEDKEGPKKMFDSLRDAYGIPEDSPMGRYSATAVKAIATMSEVKDGAELQSFVNTETNETKTVNMRRVKEVLSVTGPNWVKYTAQSNTAGLPKSEQTLLRNMQVNTMAFLAKAGDAIRLAKTSPNTLTMVSRGASIINSLEQELSALIDEVNANQSEQLEHPDVYADDLEALGINNARMKSMTISLAYQAAKAIAEASGRDVSNSDVQNFLNQIGAKTSDPETFSLVLMDVSREIDRTFRTNYKVRNKGRVYEGDDLGLADLESLMSGTTGNVRGTITPNIQQELKDLEALRKSNPTGMSIQQMQRLLELRQAGK